MYTSADGACKTNRNILPSGLAINRSIYSGHLFCHCSVVYITEFETYSTSQFMHNKRLCKNTEHFIAVWMRYMIAKCRRTSVYITVNNRMIVICQYQAVACLLSHAENACHYTHMHMYVCVDVCEWVYVRLLLEVLFLLSNSCLVVSFNVQLSDCQSTLLLPQLWHLNMGSIEWD